MTSPSPDDQRAYLRWLESEIARLSEIHAEVRHRIARVTVERDAGRSKLD